MLAYEKSQPIVIDKFTLLFIKKHCKFWIILLGKGCDRYFDMLFQKITYQKSVIFGLTIVIYDTFESHKVYFHAILLIK